MSIVALFNNKGGVGKTTVAYHLAHMMARIGCPTLAVDLDPQANLTASFLTDDELEFIWENRNPLRTVFHSIEPIKEGIGDMEPPEPLPVDTGLHVICGDLRLSLFEDKLSDAWPRCYEGDNSALRASTAFYRMIRVCAEQVGAAVVIVDVGPNLGAINRVALLAADYLVFPLEADMFSLQGLRNLGPTVNNWRENWRTILSKYQVPPIETPPGAMKPLGYVVLQHAVRLDRPVKSYERWFRRIPEEYRQSVLNQGEDMPPLEAPDPDPYCLATLRHYRSLIPMAHDARKPVFDLKPADGAIGGHAKLVETARKEFQDLASAIAQGVGAVCETFD